VGYRLGERPQTPRQLLISKQHAHTVAQSAARWVRHHSDAHHAVSLPVQSLLEHAEMVLDVPGSRVAGFEAVKLGQDVSDGLPANVSQDIEASPMGHSD